MNFKEFKRKLRKASTAGVLLSTNEPVTLSKRTVTDIVSSLLSTRAQARESGFSGRVFVSIIPLGESDHTVMLVGVDSEMEDAEEVNP